MPNQKYLLNRRRFLATTAAASGAIVMPSILRAQGGPVKLGVLHPVTGALSYSGQQGRLGATLAIEEINAAGGIKGLGKIDPVLGDAQSTPEGGTAEVEKMNSAGVAAIVGGYASNICLATTQAAARYELPYVVDVGVADGIVTRGLKNTFRFGPGFGVISKTALTNLAAINDAAGKPAKTVMIVHEDSLFGSGLAKLLVGFAVVASVLTLVGIYGVLSLSMAARRREIAVRAAIGAQGRDIRNLVLSDALRLIGGGVLSGIVAAVVLSRIFRSFLFEVEPTDPATLADGDLPCR